MRHTKHNFKARLLISTAALLSASATAQDTSAEEEDRALDAVVVTGSYLSNVETDANPVQSFDREKLESTGFNTAIEFLSRVAINGGSDFQTDQVGNVDLIGTASINLRGLGPGSTLVLLNGRRQTISGAVADDGSSFVDINFVGPSIIQNVEILTDGAAATYGSDAVAGVVNFIFRDDFEGFEATAQYSTTTQEFTDTDEIAIGLIGGKSFGKTHVVASFDFLTRTPLATTERPEQFVVPASDFPINNPGAFIIPAPFVSGATIPDSAQSVILPDGVGPLSGFGFVVDPFCGEAQNSFIFPNGLGPGIDSCGQNFGAAFQIVTPEDRFHGYTIITHELNNDFRLFAEGGITVINNDNITNPPSFPTLSFSGGGPLVPAENPGNFLGVPAIFFGLPLGYEGPLLVTTRDNDTYRGVFGLEHDDLAGWTADASYSFSRNRFESDSPDVVIERYVNALNGLGGFGCDPLTGTPGVGACEFFNPFSNAVNPNSEALGTGPFSPNSPEIVDFILDTSNLIATTTLHSIDGVVTREGLFNLPGGSVGLALGTQVRIERYEVEASEFAAEPGLLAFLPASPPFDEDRTTFAFFGEVGLPLLENLDAQFALRYENVGGVGDSVDPKFAVQWQALDFLSFRGSVGTSFRAPTLNQLNGTRSVPNPINIPAPFFAPIVNQGQDDLTSEEAFNFNLGAILQYGGMTATVDYYDYSYDDVITVENEQALVDACIASGFDPSGVCSQVLGPGGEPFTATDVTISQVNTNFVNASSIDTNGLDFSINWESDLADWGLVGFGTLNWTLKGTKIFNFDVQETEDGPVIEAADSLNAANFVRSLPDFRLNTTASWNLGAHTVTSTLRFIGAYTNDLPTIGTALGTGPEEIDSFTTVDLQYAYDWDKAGATFAIGLNNIFDEDAPFVDRSFGFDSQVADPRGRILYIRAQKRF